MTFSPWRIFCPPPGVSPPLHRPGGMAEAAERSGLTPPAVGPMKVGPEKGEGGGEGGKAPKEATETVDPGHRWAPGPEMGPDWGAIVQDMSPNFWQWQFDGAKMLSMWGGPWA